MSITEAYTAEESLQVEIDGHFIEVPIKDVEKYRTIVRNSMDELGDPLYTERYPLGEKNVYLDVNPFAVNIVKKLLPDGYDSNDLEELRLSFQPGLYTNTGLENYAKALLGAVSYFKDDLMENE